MATRTAGRTRTSSRSGAVSSSTGPSSSSKRKTSAVAGTAKRQANDVADTATQSAGDVVATGKEQAGHVAAEAMEQAQQLLDQAGDQLQVHASEQTQRLSGNIRQLAAHFSAMADAGEPGSPAQSLVRQLADRTHDAADYFDGKEPAAIVEDVQNFGRRRPGAFLLGAALAGLTAGRFVTAAKNAPAGDRRPTTSTRSTGTARTTGAGARRAGVPVDPYPEATPGGGW